MSIPRYHQQPLINGSYAHLLSEVVSKWEIPPDKLFWGTGIEQEKLNNLNYKISFLSFKKVICRAIELTNEPGLAFYAGTQLKISSHGILGFTATISFNAQQAIELINQYVELQCSFVRLSLKVNQDICHYSILYEKSLGDLHHPIDLKVYEFCCIFFLVGFVHLCQFFLPDFKPSLDLQCKCPDYFVHFQDILSTTFTDIRYEQEYTRLTAPSSFLSIPLRLSDPLAFEKFKALCQTELENLFTHQDILYQVKKSIDDEHQGLQAIDQVAKKLNLTKRTLQRMLQERQSNFQLLYNEVRREKVKKLLQYPFISREDIAKQLGYSCTSSLNRALKRWEIE